MVPDVRKCTVDHCYYNHDAGCYAHAILVGSSEPICETFAQAESQGNPRGGGLIGACHISQCVFNQKMSCHACSDVEIGWQDNQAYCKTFEPR